MITAEVEIDDNSDLDYFKSLQTTAKLTPLLVIFPHPTKGAETLVFLKAEPSLTDIIFILFNRETEEFRGYVWIKKFWQKKYYKLINYEFFIDDLIRESKFNYPINMLGKIIRDGYNLKVEDKELVNQIITIAPRLKLENGVIESTQGYFDSSEGLFDYFVNQFNSQYIKFFYNPDKYKFYPGEIVNFLNNNYENDI